MANIAVFKGTKLRATKTDACGKPISGSAHRIVTDCWVGVKADPEMKQAEELELNNAEGGVIFSDRTAAERKRYNVSLEVGGVDPDLFSLICSWARILDYNGNPIGVRDRKKVDNAAGDLAMIAGQKPVITKSRLAIAGFKLRENMAVGCKVTLRKTKMFEFVDRLVTIALPRVRDFRGLNPKSFDGRGNYSLGIKEHIVFPEIDYDKTSEVWGMDIPVCTTARTDDEARALLTAFNFPFRQ